MKSRLQVLVTPCFSGAWSASHAVSPARPKYAPSPWGEGRGEGDRDTRQSETGPRRDTHLFLAVLVSLIAIFLTGCLFRAATVSPRHFVLSTISPDPKDPPAATARPLSVGIAHVKMPPYLLRDSIAFRDGANEIGYLEDATWGERLDQCFQRTLAANLSQLLPSDSVYAVDSARNQTMMCVLVSMQQFDVDTRGRGTLIAQWSITVPEQELPFKSGRAELFKSGLPPRGHPEAIATTLSDLAANFSRQLAQALQESAGVTTSTR